MPAATPPTVTRSDRPPRGDPSDIVLARDRRPFVGLLPVAAQVDHARSGAVARRNGPQHVWRAEPGPCGPLRLEATVASGVLHCRVSGPPDTPGDHVEWAVDAVRAWTGQLDEPGELRAVVDGHDVLRRVLLRIGEVRIGSIPRMFEALGRAIVHQLVQRTEAARSVAQVARHFGEPAGGGVVTWPTPRQLGAVPAWQLRRCGISLRGARALHAAAVEDPRLEAAGAVDMAALDARLRSLPGVGPWTSAETRLALGDPDAVSVGDYNLHSWVTHALAGVDPRDSSDDVMLELLAPFAPQRGRVVTLISRAMMTGLLQGPPRRGPHARLSAHRYW